MLHLLSPIPHSHWLCVLVCACVSSAWAVGGVVVMEPVFCDVWAGLQDPNQEVCERRRGHCLQRA